jgi:hypothetical protein
MSVVNDRGVYDMPFEDYLADPVPGGSLSSTGARRLLPPSCPALFRWFAEHPEETKPEWDEGHAAHGLVLGFGAEIVEVKADSWRTDAAKASAAEAREAGKVPLLTERVKVVHAMRDALAEHPVAAALLDPDHGRPEQTLIWQDTATGVALRARLDWLPDQTPGRRLIVTDYKTAKAADTESIRKSVANFGYHVQAAAYLDGVAQVLGEDDAAFVFIFQEKSPPHLVTVVQLDEFALRVGEALWRQAINLYAECKAAGRWPGYADDVETISLPAWAERRHLESLYD